jgi:hypothetical protein
MIQRFGILPRDLWLEPAALFPPGVDAGFRFLEVKVLRHRLWHMFLLHTTKNPSALQGRKGELSRYHLVSKQTCAGLALKRCHGRTRPPLLTPLTALSDGDS